MRSEIVALPAGTTEAGLLQQIDRLNADPATHGILCQLPLPAHIPAAAVLERIAPEKDVDGFHPINVGKLVLGDPTALKPATPFGVQELLVRSDVPIAGAQVVIVGRSQLVGRPLANLLSQPGRGGDATVTLAHSRTRDLPAVCRTADILVVAVGTAGVHRRRRRAPWGGGDRRRHHAGRRRHQAPGIPPGRRRGFRRGAPRRGRHHPGTRRRRPDDDRHAAAQHAPGRAADRGHRVTAVEKAWSVAQLARALKRLVEGGSAPIWVRGEISGAKRYPSGHWYFSLHDETARVDCTLWRTAAARLAAPLADGTEVFAFGTRRGMGRADGAAIQRAADPSGGGGRPEGAARRGDQAAAAGRRAARSGAQTSPAAVSGAHRRGDVGGRSGGARRDHRRPAALARDRVAGGQQRGARRERAGRAGARARHRGASRRELDCCIVGRGGGGKDDLAAFNDEASAAPSRPVRCR